MPSAGDESDAVVAHVQIVIAKIDLLGLPLDEALADVPDEFVEAVRERIANRQIRADGERRFYRPDMMIQSGGPRPWFKGWNSADGYLWGRLRESLLLDKGWKSDDVNSLDDSSDKVLQYLEDPRTDDEHSNAEFRVQGLVLGYVQSGKTANFTALIAKAADRGYKLVIVLSGIHNSLRAQTQRRLDLELGLIDDPKGVGIPQDKSQVWWPITTADIKGDFNPGSANAAPIQQGIRSIMVVKKNATVLRRLVRWLDGRVPDDLPVLIIDDEGDQASINTKATLEDVDLAPEDQDLDLAGHELDPSTINGLVRDLLGRFHRVSFVAYTATPFANVLIDPDTETRGHGQDLFPRDFIYSLPRPARYVGAERIFGRAALDREGEPIDGLDVIRLVDEWELPELCPSTGALASGWEAEVTPSLGDAILDWILATAAKEQRLGPGISSMLIHTTMRVDPQDQFAEVVREHLLDLRRRWRYEHTQFRQDLKQRWELSFRSVIAGSDLSLDRTFDEIEDQVNELVLGFDARTVRLLNCGRNGDDLNYEDDPTQKVVLIGGNRLSRGLTIENLMCSFYVRISPNYDTLLQMARWFGYRADYVDLTRLWTTSELVSRFEHLALVEEELRDDIAIYERDRLTPLDVAPKIRVHPVMAVTADNKMGSGRTVFQSYSGERIQTTRFRLGDDAWLESNVNTTTELLRSLGPPIGSIRGDTRRPTWREVPWEYVAGFLENFQSVQAATSFDAATAARYVSKQAEDHDELRHWTVSVRSATRPDSRLRDWDLGIEGWGRVAAIERSRKKVDLQSIGALVNPPSLENPAAGDEAVDLTQAQIDAAIADPFPKLGNALRAQRPPSHGLLLLYPISPYSKRQADSDQRLDLFDSPDGRPLVVGAALSFPPSNSPSAVEYVVGKRSRTVADDDE